MARKKKVVKWSEIEKRIEQNERFMELLEKATKAGLVPILRSIAHH